MKGVLNMGEALNPAAAVEKVAYLESDMKRTYDYVWRRGVLLIFFAQPIYEALVGLREYIAAEESKPSNKIVIDLPFKIPVPLFFPPFVASMTIYRIQVTSVDGKFEFNLRPWRWLEYLVSKFPRAKRAFSLPLSAAAIRLASRVGLPLRDRSATPADRVKFLILLLLFWVASSLCIIPFNLIRALGWALFRGIAITMKSALRPIPALLAVLFVVFASGDSWRIFGQEPYWRFAALIVILLGAGLAAMAVNLLGAKNGWRSILEREIGGDQALREWAERTPARVLCAALQPVSPLGRTFGESREGEAAVEMPRAFTVARRLLGKNIAVVFWFTMTLNVIAITFWVSLLFITVGTVAISSATTNDLLNSSPQHSAAVALTPPFGLLGQQFVITRQLVLLSVVLGAVAALNFATSTLQNANDLEAFTDHALRDLRQALAALSYYLGAVAALLVELKENGALQRLKDTDSSDVADIAKFLESPGGAPLPAGGPPPVTGSS